MPYGYVSFLYGQDELELAMDHISKAGYQGIELHPNTIDYRKLSIDLENLKSKLLNHMGAYP